ncbi:class I SAM-dependent methyltransferase [Nonomuraea sediminis]|uniref:class I SAM-dependent methyltransferase n=1 Tax=Nonomuraea sediminis TaxID=2835864 RepID=UPI001BDC1D8E|nr:class I SAM-dependent methyltransferase [Nonomuraea sediminis]
MVDRSRRWLTGRWFDVRMGTDTSGTPADRGIAHQELEHQPSDLRKIRRALRALRPGPDDVVIDYGAGLGRMMLVLARDVRVRRIIGVEHQAELYQRAQRNIAAARPKLRCKDISIEQADARKYKLPDDVTVVYFYNPFREPTLREVMERIVESLRRVPRKLTIVYNNPPAWSSAVAEYGFERQMIEQRLHFYHWMSGTGT